MGWNLWVWLECIGVVVSGCCCKEVYKFIQNISFPYSTCTSAFFGSSIPTSLFIFKMFFCSFMYYVLVIHSVFRGSHKHTCTMKKIVSSRNLRPKNNRLIDGRRARYGITEN